ncbi:MAG TPA: STAS domain-containing protein [Chthoniobacterales bacterium]|jgi:anti-anti-sigma factor
MSLPNNPPQVLILNGEIDLHVSSDVAASLARLVEQQPSRLIVNLREVTYIDSSGLAALITAANNVEDYGGKLMLTGVRAAVRTILENARLDQFFLLYPHVDAALAAT